MPDATRRTASGHVRCRAPEFRDGERRASELSGQLHGSGYREPEYRAEHRAPEHRTPEHRASELRGAGPRAERRPPPPSQSRLPVVARGPETRISVTEKTPAKAARRSGSRTSLFSKVFTIATLAALWIGWVNSDDSGLTPVSGTGYWLGIAGSVLMLLLLLYPLRKRIPALRAIGSVTFWFNTHMMLGVVGPVLVLWHANFKLGSINCSVALITMVVVAVSGVFGRYLHRKVNIDLEERKALAREVVADADELRGFLGSNAAVANHMVADLNAFSEIGTRAPRGAVFGLLQLPLVWARGAVLRVRLMVFARQVIAVEGRRCGRSRQVQDRQLAGVDEFVSLHLAAARRAAALGAYERLFRLWHLLHLPLFYLLVIVAVVHVYASHFF